MGQAARRLLTLSVRATSPGQRFRIQQWAPGLTEDAGITTAEHAFALPSLERVLDRRGELIVKTRETIRSWASYARRFPPLSDVDAVLIYREAVPVGPNLAERRLRRWNGPIALDVDDPIFLAPRGSANRSARAITRGGAWKRLCRISDLSIAINQQIAEVLAEHTRKVVVIPNVVDLDRYPHSEPEGHRVPVIGFSGSPSTMPMLNEIAQPLRRLAAEEEFELQVIGGRSPIREGVSVRELPWAAEREASLLSGLDIGVAPAPDDEWNRFKFPVKILLYMAAGRPLVASPVGSAREVITDGENGYLASTPDEWVERLRHLLRDPDARARMGRAARRTIEERYSLSALRPMVAGVFTELMGGSERP